MDLLPSAFYRMSSSLPASLSYTALVSLLLAQQTLWPEGWELVGRIVVVIGVSGLFGLASRHVGIWLKTRYRNKRNKMRPR
jgi:hypothetical protein